MKSNFFSRKTPIFGTRAVLVLCIVFFLAPFALRGARLAVERLENDIKDWLPAGFPETRDLDWFGKHFMGERFVLITWPSCTVDQNEFQLLQQKLLNEVETNDPLAFGGDPNEEPDSEKNTAAGERLRAKQMGDRLGLFVAYQHDEKTGRISTEYYENSAGLGEKWLRGEADRWYFVTPDGNVYDWGPANSWWGALWRGIQRQAFGSFKAGGEELVGTYGKPTSGTHTNEFWADPRHLAARFFNSITTGPDALREMSAKNGPLWPRSTDIDDEDRPRIARQLALERLTSTLFGPATQPGFAWTTSAFHDVLSEQTRSQLPDDWEAAFESYVDKVTAAQFSGKHDALVSAAPIKQSQIWDELFVSWKMDPPPRQTCIIVTLSEAGKKDPRRVLGRAIMGKPLGTLLALSYESGIAQGDLKLGGPPVDNVAIDEEGSITLFRLIAWSAVIGFGLSYICFRSFVTTLMVFFVGGVSAVTSLSMVWWSGASVDAVLMSMPALVYVLGLSGAIHIINYYREAVETDGPENAATKALLHGWGPCTLAAFTTALGLISLYASNLLPIKKFGLFSAIGVMATLVLMFTYLPAALTTWPPKIRRRKEGDAPERKTLSSFVERWWLGIGRWVIDHHAPVLVVTTIVMFGCALGLPKIDPSVQLLKLFDKKAKIIGDYKWLELNFGKLVPMELVVRVKPEAMLKPDTKVTPIETRTRYNFLERIELAHRVQKVVETYFGEAGQDIVGPGVSPATFGPPLPSAVSRQRSVINLWLEEASERFYEEDYLATDKQTDSDLLRVSLRLGALNNVDYGEFVNELRQVVEPVMTAHRFRDEILREIETQTGGEGVRGTSILLLGTNRFGRRTVASQTTNSENEASLPPATTLARDVAKARDDPNERLISPEIQTEIFAQTLNDLLLVESFRSGNYDTKMSWHDPLAPTAKPLSDWTEEFWETQLDKYNLVTLVQNHADYPLDLIRAKAKSLLDATNHRFEVGISDTSVQRDDLVSVVYTGVVPVVYKAQRTLLNSLINSIGLAFVMIALVMMVLLRDWWSPMGRSNGINVSAGLISMIPNVFPVVLVFGLMGHMSSLVDIGTMMTASVAMGVAVDDTIHFLTWFRIGIREGLSRRDAILEAYRRVATAMTQTTLIGGLGLSVFAASTFTPTQQFGVMMVFLLTAALMGDLIVLPAILAGPLGRFFCPKVAAASESTSPVTEETNETAVATAQPVASTGQTAPATQARSRDQGTGFGVHPDHGHPAH